MDINKLKNKVSSDDIERTKDIRNPPEFEPGFDGGSDGFDDLFDDFNFDDLDDSFGGDSNKGNAGNDGNANNVFGSTGGNNTFGAGGNNIFGAGGNTFGAGGNTFGGVGQPGSFSSSFGNQFNQQTTAPPSKPDTFDKIFDASGVALNSFGQMIIELFKSIRNRNADDIGYLNRNLFITGGILTAISIVLGLLGWAANIRFLTLVGISGEVLIASVILVGTGVTGIAIAAIAIANANNDNTGSIEQLPNVSDLFDDDFTKEYEDNIGDILEDLFEDDESLFDELEETEEEKEEDYTPDFNNVSFKPEQVDYKEQLNALAANQLVTRERLFTTFKPFFPMSTPTFADKKELSIGSDEFITLETICLKALSNVCKCEMEDVNSKLESAIESYFSYELRMKRIRGINKIDEIAREMEAYFRESSTDKSVNATVDIEGDFYKITVTKGENAIVTFGDIFKQQYVCDFMLNSKNQLPMIVGVDELGNVILDDAKPFDTMMIAGKPRSGKSWYVLSVLMGLTMFNSPEDVQIVICDPKESNLFNTLALMPHVAGLHNDDNILEIMRDIINNEGERRKKILADNRCDDIWALRKKGIRLPILYLVIDEIITVKNNLASKGEKEDKEFDNLMQILISKLPYVGIRLIFVPHRATGIVNKTNRTMLQFTAAVRSNPDDVCDTLDIKRWNRALVNPGDIAVKLSTREEAMYVRGASVTTSDEDNTDLIINAAKAFYKMGVDLPDMTTLQVAFNRDERYIREELDGNGNRIQYDLSEILK